MPKLKDLVAIRQLAGDLGLSRIFLSGLVQGMDVEVFVGKGGTLLIARRDVRKVRSRLKRPFTRLSAESRS